MFAEWFLISASVAEALVWVGQAAVQCGLACVRALGPRWEVVSLGASRRRNPTITVVDKLAVALGVQVGALLDAQEIGAV